MKSLKVVGLLLIIASIITACGGNNDQLSSQANNATNVEKQKEIEVENERLKAEAEQLKKELAEKEAAEQKEQEDQEAQLATAEEQETSNETRTADIMQSITAYYTGEDLNEKTYNYIVKHHKLFPAGTVELKKEAEAEVDKNITSRHLFKNVSPYVEKMIKTSGYVVQISEEDTEEVGTVAEIHILDEEGNSIVGIYTGSTGDILEDDYVTMRGVPAAQYSFENIGGGTTNAILLAVSTIQKSQ